jgi:hypothetical protein
MFARVETEQAADASAETFGFGIAAHEIQVETMRQMEVATMLGQPKRRREADQRKIRLERIQRGRIVVRRGVALVMTTPGGSCGSGGG